MSNYRTIFQDHHNIEQQTLKNSELLAKLQDAGKFDIHARENRLFLPTSPQFAQPLGITPHSGGPLGAYQYGMLARLDRLQVTLDGQAAMEGDLAAMDRVAKRVEQLRDTVKVGLINGDLNTNTPLGETPASTSQKVRQFFDNIPAYYQTHIQQIEALKGFSGIDHGWGAIANSESRIVTTLNQIHVDSRPLIRGGDIELQRTGLAVAIANAHHDGRVVISEPGIRRVELVLGEESAYRIRVPHSQQGAVSMELLMGEASARTLVRSGGLLATGADAIMTARRSAELLEQGNATAAQSEVNHAIARNVGGWAGGASTAMALGGSGFVPAAVIAADALLLSKAFEKGADLLDNRAIYHQTDKAGVEWQFNGRNWERQAAIDRTPDGHTNPVREAVVASYEKSQELGAMASAKAVELALGKAPAPQDPFTIPAQPSDRRGVDNRDWRRNPETQEWERQVKTEVTGANERGSYFTEVASPERAKQLNSEALSRIEANIATGREAIAAAYLESHAAQRAQHHGVNVPEAVTLALAKEGVVLGSNNQLYQRNDVGEWVSKGGLASGNLALELELTNQMRQPSLEQSRENLAAIQALPSPSAAQQETNELLHRYRTVGVDLNVNPETQQAIELAVQRTLPSNGVSGPTMQQLQRNESGQYGFDSPIVHYQVGVDGVAHQVAITSQDDLRQAWVEIRAQRPDSAPLPDSPELRIAALSPKEQDAYQQALHEANRLGAASIDIQHAASTAVLEARGIRPGNSGTSSSVLDEVVETEVPQHSNASGQTSPIPAPVSPATMLSADTIPPSVSPSREQRQPELDASLPSGTQRNVSKNESPNKNSEISPDFFIAETHEGHQLKVVAVANSQNSSQLVQESSPAADMSSPASEKAESTGSQEPLLIRDSAVVVRPMAVSSGDETRAEQYPQLTAAEVFCQEHGIVEPVFGESEVGEQLEGRLHEREYSSTSASLEAIEQSEEKLSPSESQSPGSSTHPENAVDLQMRQGKGDLQDGGQPMQPGHPDHGLYLQVRQCVVALDAQHGRSFDAVSERMTASLLVLAKDNDLDRVDSVLVSNATAQHPAGHTVFVVQGEPGNPAHLRAAMPTEQAIKTAVEESMQQFEAVSQEAHQRALANQQEQQLEDQRVQQENQVHAITMG